MFGELDANELKAETVVSAYEVRGYRIIYKINLLS